VNSQSMLIRAGDMAFCSHASMRHLVVVPAPAPSPLMGEGWGEGENSSAARTSAPPLSPTLSHKGREGWIAQAAK
jgi:hypothetical protein